MFIGWSLEQFGAAPELHVAALCPAGHLPHKGGDQLSHRLSPISCLSGWAPREMKADLPPCGGDVRQDSGGAKELHDLPFGLSHGVSMGGRIVAGEMMFELAFDVGQKARCAEAEEVRLQPAAAEFLLHQ